MSYVTKGFERTIKYGKAANYVVIVDSYNSKVKEILEKLPNPRLVIKDISEEDKAYLESKNIEVNDNLICTAILEKYGKYQVQELKDYNRYHSKAIQDKIQKYKDTRKKLQKEIREHKKHNENMEAHDKQVELEGIKYQLRVIEPMLIEKYYGVLVFERENNILKEYLEKKRLSIDSSNDLDSQNRIKNAKHIMILD